MFSAERFVLVETLRPHPYDDPTEECEGVLKELWRDVGGGFSCLYGSYWCGFFGKEKKGRKRESREREKGTPFRLSGLPWKAANSLIYPLYSLGFRRIMEASRRSAEGRASRSIGE